MKIKSTKFTGLKIIQSKNYRDSRGFFKEDFKKKFFKDKKFVFGCTSSSKKNVVRGLHLQTKFSQGKYLSVLKGSIFDVAVDLRKDSKTFRKYFKIISSKLFIYAKDNEKKTKYYLKLYWYNFLLVVLVKMIVYKSTGGMFKKLWVLQTHQKYPIHYKNIGCLLHPIKILRSIQD